MICVWDQGYRGRYACIEKEPMLVSGAFAANRPKREQGVKHCATMQCDVTGTSREITEPDIVLGDILINLQLVMQLWEDAA